MESNIFITKIIDIIIPHEAIVNEDTELEEHNEENFVKIVSNSTKGSADDED